ncbi:Hypothetical predicted protein, partial [Podarcis lilfordi]
MELRIIYQFIRGVDAKGVQEPKKLVHCDVIGPFPQKTEGAPDMLFCPAEN